MSRITPEQYFAKRLPNAGIFTNLYWLTGAGRPYMDGDAIRFSMRWWHPVTLILLAVLTTIMIPVCLFSEASVQFYLSEVWQNLTVRRYFKTNPDKLYFLKRAKVWEALRGR